MSQNYPNPSNPKSKIDYQIPADGKVTIKLYDVIGREAVTIVNETKEAGYYTAEFDGTDLASGVYFYRLVAGEYKMVKKLVLVK
jgi:Secretion system C-terminal sorting domain